MTLSFASQIAAWAKAVEQPDTYLVASRRESSKEVIAEEKRQRILEFCHIRRTASEMREALGMTYGGLSHNLDSLRDSGRILQIETPRGFGYLTVTKEHDE